MTYGTAGLGTAPHTAALLLETASARVASSKRSGFERVAATWKDRNAVRFTQAVLHAVWVEDRDISAISTVLAIAGALGVRLGGPTQYQYELQIRPTLGDMPKPVSVERAYLR